MNALYIIIIIMLPFQNVFHFVVIVGFVSFLAIKARMERNINDFRGSGLLTHYYYVNYNHDIAFFLISVIVSFITAPLLGNRC